MRHPMVVEAHEPKSTRKHHCLVLTIAVDCGEHKHDVAVPSPLEEGCAAFEALQQGYEERLQVMNRAATIISLLLVAIVTELALVAVERGRGQGEVID